MSSSRGLGIPFNLALAIMVGAAFSVQNSQGNAFQSDLAIIGVAVGLILQEAILVQILSREANSEFELRLLQHDVTKARRNFYLFVPFLVFSLMGLFVAIYSPRAIDIQVVVRIIAVSMIFTLCLDPILGLMDKGPTLLIGAGLAYLFLLQQGAFGYPNIADWLSQRMPSLASDLISTSVLTYLVLSCRWTYYKLFCFEEMEDWKKAAADTFVPFLILFMGALPDTFRFITLLFTGSYP